MYLPFLLIIGLTFVAASIGISVLDASEPLGLGVRTLLALGVGILYFTNAAIGVRLGRPVRRIAMLVVPGLLLPALACFASEALAAWATLALVALALVALDLVSLWMGRTAARTVTSPAPAQPA